MKVSIQRLGLAFLVASTVFNSYAQTGDTKAPIDLVASAADISNTMKTYVYDRSVLVTPAYQKIQRDVLQLAQQAKTQSEFVEGFNQIWKHGPFSHVQLAVAKHSAEQMTDYFDAMNAGGKGAILSWQGDVAVLTVNTMMGLDTISQIDAAYQTMTDRKAKALIIDLRNNEGGAFAVRPLLSHVVSSKLDAGFFLSQRWTIAHQRLPDQATIAGLTPWQGWSVKTFWRDVQNNDVTRIQFEPTVPHFAGEVYVLTSKRTASAAELATDALLASGRATVIGEQTAGEMLSQKLYDLPQGLQLSLPIADYYGAHTGRIEGQGIKPNIMMTADAAMAHALTLASSAK
ncbi:MAG: S41 family peptidase [Gammaproteobacteria bacterium]|nr:S41 family peptidase [Gammaproteobacteria bacterium]MBU2225812.1 S41 family peptidase [Gammaproteobacteria bacterium]MBU2426194.1 S41 family peptidase [Gammaproteobacteria bacterium]